MILYRKFQLGGRYRLGGNGKSEKDQKFTENLNNLKNAQKDYLLSEVDKQKQWMLDYHDSPKFRERMVRQYGELDGLDDDISQRKYSIINTDASMHSGRYIPMGDNLAEALYRPGWSQMTDTFANNQSPYLKNPAQSEEYRGAHNWGHTEYANNPRAHSQTPLGVHEYTHASTRGNDWLGDAHYNSQPENYVHTGDYANYVRGGAEQHAGLNELRYIASELGIYDANTEEFTAEHFDALENLEAEKLAQYKAAVLQNVELNDPQLKNPIHYDAIEYPDMGGFSENAPMWNLRQAVEGEGMTEEDVRQRIIWMMNNIAQNQADDSEHYEAYA